MKVFPFEEPAPRAAPDVAGWVFFSALGAPVVLVVSATVARMSRVRPYDPITQTMSVLAASGRGEWIMTGGIVLSALCQALTGCGLRVLSQLARVALVVAGLCGVAVAAFPVVPYADARFHLLAAGAGAIVLALWPVLAISSKHLVATVRRVRWSITATVVLSLLVGWVYWETRTGVMLGLAERIAAVAETGARGRCVVGAAWRCRVSIRSAPVRRRPRAGRSRRARIVCNGHAFGWLCAAILSSSAGIDGGRDHRGLCGLCRTPASV